MSGRKGTKALELWCKRLVRDCPEVQIDNMTTSWRNGIAFCALVHHFRPDLIDMSSLKPEDIYNNNQLAFSIAEKHLGIPALLDPEDMVENDVPDRLSILTYLSQFYQRLGHTVNSKANDSEPKVQASASPPQPSVITRFGKTGLDKCTACGLPVYLAQRLIVSHKLYHRQCFRCSKCAGHLNPNNFKTFVGTEFTCDSCKNDRPISKLLNNNNDVQMGMLQFSDILHPVDDEKAINRLESKSTKQAKPQSILDKINMFEKTAEKENIEDKLDSLSLKEKLNNKCNKDKNLSLTSTSSLDKTAQTGSEAQIKTNNIIPQNTQEDKPSINLSRRPSDSVYKSDLKKYSFLQTQLTGETDPIIAMPTIEFDNKSAQDSPRVDIGNFSTSEPKEEFNVTDDIRLANTVNSNLDISSETIASEPEPSIVPPRRKKRVSAEQNNISDDKNIAPNNSLKLYPDHLCPFSDDDGENEVPEASTRKSTNPFGSDDDDDIPIPEPSSRSTDNTRKATPPMKRLITAYNPFWSDGEEPSSDEETREDSSLMYKSPITASTPNLRISTPRKKSKAPAPPPSLTVVEAVDEKPSTSMDDVRSLSSVSSFNSTVHSDQKSLGKLTPKLKKKRTAPTPPDSISTLSGGSRDLHGACGSMEHGVDTTGLRDGGCRRAKGPAPGLPLPERRAVRLQLSPHELQVQLELLETQQLGLERQGVLVERMIRDKCEGDDTASVPQEEVEDLVIQLCELVNEKNDLFRKQTELMYIRRQQRLEQEQADIEHEIRVIQSRPAVNRIDADKAREEQLVSRLVEIVRLRDELVQQMDAERRRERQEDLAIASSIATRRAQRNSDSNCSSIKSEVVSTPKKSNKVKDKMKKQFKKAKHTLIPKKKEDPDRKEDKLLDKESKSK